jgi:hypothetical protein
VIGIASSGLWFHHVRTGLSGSSKLVAEGLVLPLDTGLGGSNHIEVSAFGDSGSLFVNRNLVVTLNLGGLTASGDASVMTGFFAGDVMACSTTDFEGFMVQPY